MDSIYFINSCATIIYGFFFGMSLAWWIEHYLQNDSKNVKNDKTFDKIFNEIKFLKIELDVFETKLAILNKLNKKKLKQT